MNGSYTVVKSLAVAAAFGVSSGLSSAQSHATQASAGSALSMASAIVVGAEAVSGIPVALAQSGAEWIVSSVEASANGSVHVLERIHDGARASIAFAAGASGASMLIVGTVVQTTATSTGVIVSAAGQALAFIPNELGKALLHHEKVSR